MDLFAQWMEILFYYLLHFISSLKIFILEMDVDKISLNAERLLLIRLLV